MRRALMIMALACLTARAEAIEWGVRIEPGAAFPLASPQTRLFDVGGGFALKGGVTPLRLLDVFLSLQFVGLPAADVNPNRDTGVAWALGAGVRVKRPHGHTGFLYPWADADLQYVRSGDLDRFGFSVAVGLAVTGGKRRMFWVGPFVRYHHIVSPDRAGFDTADAMMLIAGISVEFSPTAAPKPAEAAALPVDRGPEPDTDQDGIADSLDRCPDQPEDKDGFEDQDGCPDPDNDGDGVADETDKCRNDAEDKDGFADDDGCPELDNDEDGVVDAEDACPNLAGPKDGKGCPDRDKDGVEDPRDNCPDVAGPADNQGCPVYKAVKVTKEKIEIQQKIFFANNQSKILPKSFPLLEEVARALKENSSLRVRVEGHTDSTGKAERNTKLSDERAQAVRKFLVDKGVQAERLEAKGYGPKVPIGDNKTEAGREKNRRVEFVIITEGGAK